MRAPEIRPYAPTGREAIIGLIAEFLADHPSRAVDRDGLDAVIRAFDQASLAEIYVADRDGAVVGYIAVHWVPFPMLQGWEAYISDLIVLRSARGAGVGRRLVAAVETAARARDCQRLMLNSRKAAKAFRRGFYPALGFHGRDDFMNFVKDLR